MAKAILTQARLKELLHYDPDTGVFTWLVSRSGRYAGANAGSADPKDGYVMVKIAGRDYRAHRLAWLYVTGAWPEKNVDHKDAVKINNAWSNLREATDAENTQNRIAPRADNACGFLGVHKASKKKWRAQISVAGKTMQLGRFNSPEEAHAAYVNAKRTYHPFGNL